ncbi:MAG TPA: DUF5668 domain-containing protein [Bryobacteraceae bacterium]|nr:DUF5668 domain-containing protein [Bryobacteraceae bacterium]
MNPTAPVNPELQSPSGAPASPEPQVPEVPAEPAAAAPKIVGYCRECGKALDETSVQHALGTIYCEEHRPEEPSPRAGGDASGSAPPPLAPASSNPVINSGSPYTAPPYHANQPPPLPPSSTMSVSASPALAFALGLIPGVGAVYNGQYAKGLMHVVILGSAISLVSSGAVSGFGPLFGLLISCFWFYMAFEAYHTAKKRRAGEPVDEFSSVFPPRGPASRVPVAPIVLIALGALFLLSNLEVIEMRKLLRYWPALLIVMGVYMIYARMTVAAEGKHNGQ